MREEHSRRREQRGQRCGCWKARAYSTSIVYFCARERGGGHEGSRSRCSSKDWLRLGLDNPGRVWVLICGKQEMLMYFEQK